MLVAVTLAPPATALVAGGGKKKSDCYIAFDGIAASGKTTCGDSEVDRVDCADGDPCDVDVPPRRQRLPGGTHGLHPAAA